MGKFHPDGSYGRSYCPVKNSLRLAIMCFEDEEGRAEMLKHLAPMQVMTDHTEFVSWLKTTDSEGYTWFAEVIDWIDKNVLRFGEGSF